MACRHAACWTSAPGRGAERMKQNVEECRWIQESISALLDGELPGNEAVAILGRIKRCASEGCGECVRLLDDLKALRHCRQSMEAADCHASPEVLADLRGRLRRFLRRE